MYSNIIEISPIPPEPHRPRIVQRMMLRREQDTVLPWSFYTNTDNILRSSIYEQNKRQAKKEKQEMIQKELIYPSIAFSNNNNPHLKRQEELAFSIREDERYRFYFPHNYLKEVKFLIYFILILKTLFRQI
jgi:alkylated DNA nucleotide flippase Atl1